MSTLIRCAALAAVLLLLAGCSSRGGVVTANGLLPTADPVALMVGRPDYRIGPSDLLAVTVFQVEDLDREVRVNNAGQVSLPLIGVVDVVGKTVSEVESQISARYAARYLQDPQVTIFVKEFASQRVTVGGAVKKPGIYPITSRITLLQAIATAEGLTDIASVHNVLVFRNSGGKREFARFDIKAIQAGEHADPELLGEDVVVVDTSKGRVAFQNLIKVAPFVAVWRAYQ